MPNHARVTKRIPTIRDTNTKHKTCVFQRDLKKKEKFI